MIKSIGNMFFIAGMSVAVASAAITGIWVSSVLYFILTAIDLMVPFNLTAVVAALAATLIAVGVSNA